MNKTEQEQDREQPPRSLAEWVTLGIASAILSAIVGLVIYTWVTQKDEPPILSVSSKNEIRQAQGQYYIPFQLTNNGGKTAESVQVIAELRTDGEVTETGEQQIDFLSSGEIEEGAFIFTRNPRQGQLSIRVASYKIP